MQERGLALFEIDGVDSLLDLLDSSLYERRNRFGERSLKSIHLFERFGRLRRYEVSRKTNGQFAAGRRPEPVDSHEPIAGPRIESQSERLVDLYLAPVEE